MDDILVIHHDPNDVLNKLHCYVPLKTGSVCSPDMYLDKKLMLMQLHNSIGTRSLSLSKYFYEAVGICEEYDVKHLSQGYRLPKRGENPSSMVYCPE